MHGFFPRAGFLQPGFREFALGCLDIRINVVDIGCCVFVHRFKLPYVPSKRKCRAHSLEARVFVAICNMYIQPATSMEKTMTKISQFEVGTIVRLKSGGPDMTIKGSANTSGTHASCQWFAGKKLEQGSFPLDSLELVKPEPKGE